MTKSQQTLTLTFRHSLTIGWRNSPTIPFENFLLLLCRISGGRQRRVVRVHARQPGEGRPRQVPGPSTQETLSLILGRSARIRHVERQEAGLVPGT